MISFALLRAIPGNVAAAVMGPNVYRDPAAIKLFDDTYGFNRPWYSAACHFPLREPDPDVASESAVKPARPA